MKSKEYFINIAIYNEDNRGAIFRIVQHRGGERFSNCGDMGWVACERANRDRKK